VAEAILMAYPDAVKEKEIDNNNDTAQYAHSLNRDRRKRELQRITKQNLQILTTIEESRPTFDHSTYEEEARVQDRIMVNICEL